MLQTLTTKFLKSYLLFSLVVFMLMVPVYILVPYPPSFLVIMNAVFLFVITLVTGLALAQTFQSKHFQFMTAMTGGTFSKLLIAPLFLYFLISNFPEHAVVTVFSFLGGYLLFTGFELYQLMRNLRPHLKKEQKSENR